MIARLSSALCALTAFVSFGARPADTLRQRVDGADIIAVASLLRSGPVPAGLTIGKPRVPQQAHVYPCAIDLDVQSVLKGSLDHDLGGITVFSYLRSADCRLELMGHDIGKGQSIIWLLRKEGTTLRTWVDNYPTMIRLMSYPPPAHQEAERLGGARVAVGYLLLAPDVGVPSSNYTEASPRAASDVIEMVGFEAFWKLMSIIYTEAPWPTRGKICMLASGYGACLTCARAAVARGLAPAPVSEDKLSLLRPDGFRQFVQQMLRDIGPDSVAHLRDSPASAARLKEDLFWNACVSSYALRTRARGLLRTLFGVDPQSITCIPCARQN